MDGDTSPFTLYFFVACCLGTNVNVGLRTYTEFVESSLWVLSFVSFMTHRLDSVFWHVSTCSHLVYPQRSFSHSHATRDKERECLCRRRTRNYRENGTTSVHSVLSECGESCAETNDMIKWLSESIPRAILKC